MTIWIIVYLISAVIFANSFKIANRGMKDATLLTILLELCTAFFAILFIPFFKIKIATKASVYLILAIVVSIYAVVDRLNTEARYGLEPSVYSMLKQLSSAFIILLGILFLKENLVINKLLGALVIIGANMLLAFKKGKFQFNRYFYCSIIGSFLFAIAMIININLERNFNIGIYTFITVFFPALILFIIGKYKFKDLVNEYNRYNKKLFILSGLTWALMLISSVKAYATGSVVIVAAMLSLTGVINSIIEFIIKRDKKEFLKKVLISILILIGIILIKY